MINRFFQIISIGGTKLTNYPYKKNGGGINAAAPNFQAF